MRKLFILLLSGLLISAASAQAPGTSKNMNLLSNVTFATAANDVWAYVDGDDNEYALVGCRDSIIVIDVTVPTSPTMVDQFGGPSSIWRDLKVYGDYAYIIHDNTSGGDAPVGLVILDMSGLPGGTIAYKDTIMDGHETVHNIWIENNFLYMTGGPPFANDGISVYDLSPDPMNPVFLGEWTEEYVHDVYVRNDTAYAAAIYTGELVIIDFTTKSSPVTLGAKSYEDSFTHNTWLNDAGDICFTTDELEEAYLYSWDVSDPTNITFKDRIRSSLSSGQSIPHNVHVLNDYLVTSYYSDGVNVVDGSRPHNLIETGYYDTSSEPFGSFAGCWGAYPFLPSGICLATDGVNGLFVLQPNYTRGCYAEGTVTDSVTGLPISGAEVQILTTSAMEITGTAGEYATGVADSGSYTIRYSAFGYNSKDTVVTLDNGVLFTGDIELSPIDRMTFTINVVDTSTGMGIASAMIEGETTGGDVAYTTDGSGMASDTNFIEGTWTFLVGKWGYVTKEVTVAAGAGTSSITVELNPGYYDDFALDFGWTVSGDASAGIWERGEPEGTTFGPEEMNPDEDISGDFGDQAYVTGNGGGSAGADDVDDGETILTSPVMDLSTYSEPQIQVYRWFANDGGSGSPNDSLVLRLSNGTTTVTLINIDIMFNNWKEDMYNVTDFLTPTSTMTFSAICSDQPSGHLSEGAIDGFQVVDDAGTNVDKPLTAATFRMEAYPSPMTGEALNVSVVSGRDELVSMRMVDLNGKIIQSGQINIKKGENSFELNGMNKLSDGIYFLTIEAQDRIITQKLVK